MNIPREGRRRAYWKLAFGGGRWGVYACVRSNVVVAPRFFFFLWCTHLLASHTLLPPRRRRVTTRGASSAAVLLRGGFFPPCCNTSHRKDPTHRRRATRRVRHVAKTTSTVLRCFCAGFSYTVFFPICTVCLCARAPGRSVSWFAACRLPRGLDVVFCLHDHPDGFHHVSSPCSLCLAQWRTL